MSDYATLSDAQLHQLAKDGDATAEDVLDSRNRVLGPNYPLGTGTYSAKISGLEQGRNLLAIKDGGNMRLGITDTDGIGFEAAITITPESAEVLAAWLAGWGASQLRQRWIATAYPEVAAAKADKT